MAAPAAGADKAMTAVGVFKRKHEKDHTYKQKKKTKTKHMRPMARQSQRRQGQLRQARPEGDSTVGRCAGARRATVRCNAEAAPLPAREQRSSVDDALRTARGVQWQ